MAYAIVVEDGTGLSTANSYMTAATANGHIEASFLVMGLTADPTDVEDIDCTNASFFLDAEFMNRWKGQRLNKDQLLAHPRVNIVDYDGYGVDADSVPSEIVKAASVMAYYLKNEPASVMPNQASPGAIKSEKKKVGPIEKATEYMGGKSQDKFYRYAMSLIKDFIEPVGIIGRA